MTDLFTIATVSMQTGIAKEVLRKWETRYGFPVPVRDDSGNRVYTAGQIARLKLIKRLLDDGMRPGQVVSMDEAALQALAGQKQALPDAGHAPGLADHVVTWLQLRDPARLRQSLREELQQRGLLAFVGALMPAMNARVGQAWEKGEIAVRDEHLYTEMVQGLVREAIASQTPSDSAPRLLLTTPPGEAHTLGVLMLEAIMTVNQAFCISLGAQSPLDEIVSAAVDFRADIVALSFSMAYPKKKIAPLLKEVRTRLPGHTQLWAGGAGILGLERTPRGVILLGSLADAVTALQKFR